MPAPRLKDCLDRRDIVAHPELTRRLLYTAETCPDCGAPLSVDLQALKVTPGAVRAAARVRALFCSGCEFIREF